MICDAGVIIGFCLLYVICAIALTLHIYFMLNSSFSDSVMDEKLIEKSFFDETSLERVEGHIETNDDHFLFLDDFCDSWHGLE